ncbi:peptidase E [Pseudoleptotrichia goodfellowii]|uniref:Peptidase n=1 Tax=Pseudoleptotrichia goodfellowii TaxID=157692 RepID=A0A510JC58_9FUSO|nr:Type 1 glutamine amidotransferase-like domain-containing protein [Pseudoleptotrichia goodfellowii]MBF4805196.1 Type 1 glutamine amidotransferase-like domain-containing protein [Pseudoleptotrichia goodfellowii]BBM36686.1 peptidase [Pseudoleptotrichia goodfellowii]
MKKMFLVSSFKDVAAILPNFEKNLKGKTVTFIPTASIPEKVKFYVNAGKKALEKLGMTVDTLEISALEITEISKRIKENDFIYVTGGNTFFLLSELKRTGADKVIIEEINNGKLYIGESAGAMITSKNIEYVKLMDNAEKAPNLKNFDALGLIEFYIVPHYKNFPFQKISQKIIDTYSDDLELQPISNNEAVLVEDDKINIEKADQKKI